MEIDISGGGWQRRASAFDSSDGRRRWALAFDGGGGRQLWKWRRWRWCLMEVAPFNGVRWRQRWTTTRGREGGTRKGNATTSQHNERTRGWCNLRTTRDDGATTSWRDETTRGGTTRWRDDETMIRRYDEAMRR
jgi:hypothetical protein